MYKILLHIGLPKTATTSLQCNVLTPLHAQRKLNFLGRYLEAVDDDFYNPIGKIICQLDEEKTDQEIFALQKDLYEILDTSRLNVISEECISLTHNEKHILRFQNLSKLFGGCDVRLLVSLRNPVDFIFSYYVEMHKWHYWSIKSSDTFEKFVVRLLSNPNKSEFDILFFHRFINQIKKNFHSVQVVLFEDIKNDPETYFLALSELLPESTEKLSSMFYEKVMNTRVSLTNGKVGKAIKLDQKIAFFLNRIVPLNMRLMIKKMIFLKNVYNWVLVKISKVSVGRPIEHVMNDGLMEKVKPLLLVSQHDLSMCSKEKLKKYGYLK